MTRRLDKAARSGSSLDLGLSLSRQAIRGVVDGSLNLNSSGTALSAFAQGWAEYRFGNESMDFGALAGLRLRW